MYLYSITTAWEEAAKPGNYRQLQAMIRLDNAECALRALSAPDEFDPEQYRGERLVIEDCSSSHEADPEPNEEWVAAKEEYNAAWRAAQKECRNLIYLCGFVDNKFREQMRAREPAARARAIALWQALQEPEGGRWAVLKNEAFTKARGALDRARAAFEITLEKGGWEDLEAAVQKYKEAYTLAQVALAMVYEKGEPEDLAVAKQADSEAFEELLRAYEAVKKARTTAMWLAKQKEQVLLIRFLRSFVRHWPS